MKKIFALLLAALFLFAFIGCSNTKDEDTTNPSDIVSDSQKDVAEPQQEQEETENQGGEESQDDEQTAGDAMKEAMDDDYEGTYTDGDTTVEMGGDWPDYDLLKGIPAPSVGTVSFTEEVKGVSASVMFVDMTLDDCKEYAQQLAAAGFDVNVSEASMTEYYSYSADNGEGLYINLGYASEIVVLGVTVG